MRGKLPASAGAGFLPAAFDLRGSVGSGAFYFQKKTKSACLEGAILIISTNLLGSYSNTENFLSKNAEKFS